MIAFSGINAPNTIPNDIGLIGPLGMSGISNFEIVLGVLFDIPILSDNSSTTVVISSDIEANSKNLVESCVKTPGLFGYAKKATGRLAPIIIMVSKSLRTSTALSTTYGVELMKDNVELCKKKLAGPKPSKKILEILEKNIVCHDALTYDYSFGEVTGMDKFTE